MSKAIGYALFATPIGECGIAWGEAAVVGVHWPGADAAASLARLARRYPGAAEAEPPPAVRRAMEQAVRLLSGEKVDLRDVALDFGAAPDLHLRIYERVRAIPAGETMTYGEVARALGEPPQAAQEVGQAMGRNPFPILMPCHRVLAAGGKIGGFSAPGGAATKRRLLEIEGAMAADQLPLFGS